MHLVDKQQRPFAAGLPFGGAGKDLAEIGDAVEHGRYRLEGHADLGREKPGDGRLAGAGRTPEDDRGEIAGRQHAAKPTLRPEKRLLTHHVLKALRAKQLGKRRRRQAGLGRAVEFKLGHGAILA